MGKGARIRQESYLNKIREFQLVTNGLREDLANTTTANTNLRHNLEVSTRENTRLHEYLTKVTTENIHLRADLANATTDNTRLRYLERSNSENPRLRENLTNVINENTQLRYDLAKVKLERDYIDSSFEEVAGMTLSLEVGNLVFESLIEDIQQERERLSMKVKEKEIEMKELVDNGSGLRMELATAKRDLAKAKTDLDGLVKQRDDEKGVQRIERQPPQEGNLQLLDRCERRLERVANPVSLFLSSSSALAGLHILSLIGIVCCLLCIKPEDSEARNSLWLRIKAPVLAVCSTVVGLVIGAVSWRYRMPVRAWLKDTQDRFPILVSIFKAICMVNVVLGFTFLSSLVESSDGWNYVAVIFYLFCHLYFTTLMKFHRLETFFGAEDCLLALSALVLLGLWNKQKNGNGVCGIIGYIVMGSMLVHFRSSKLRLISPPRQMEQV